MPKHQALRTSPGLMPYANNEFENKKKKKREGETKCAVAHVLKNLYRFKSQLMAARADQGAITTMFLLLHLLLLLLLSLLHLWLRTWSSGNCIGASLAGLATNSENSRTNSMMHGILSRTGLEGTRPPITNSVGISVPEPRPSFKYFF